MILILIGTVTSVQFFSMILWPMGAYGLWLRITRVFNLRVPSIYRIYQTPQRNLYYDIPSTPPNTLLSKCFLNLLLHRSAGFNLFWHWTSPQADWVRLFLAPSPKKINKDSPLKERKTSYAILFCLQTPPGVADWCLWPTSFHTLY